MPENAHVPAERREIPKQKDLLKERGNPKANPRENLRANLRENLREKARAKVKLRDPEKAAKKKKMRIVAPPQAHPVSSSLLEQL